MKRKTVHLAVLGAMAALGLYVAPAFADETGDLKAEIAAQRAQLQEQQLKMEQQRLRLEAMEKKLDALSASKAPAAQQAAAPQPAAPAVQQAAAPAKGGTFLAEAPRTTKEPGWAATSLPPSQWEPGYTFSATPVDTVTLYGLIDATISNITNANAAGDHKLSYQTAWFSGNRWGITGRHGIMDNNVGIIFKLESEFDYQTGEEDTPGVIFNRDAWVGFQSDALGKLTFGRQNAIARDFSGIYGDPYTNMRATTEEGGYTNVNNFKQLIYYAASATGTRYDRGLVWKKDFGGFVAGLGYQFGGVPGDFSNGSTQTAAVGYNSDGDWLHLAGFYNQFKVSDLQHKAWSVGGNVGLTEAWRLYSGYYKYDSEQGGGVGNRRDHAWTLSTRFTPAGPWEFDLGYQVITAVNAGVNAAGFVLIPYASTAGVTNVANGDKKTAYGSVFYHFDRRAEVYVTTDYMKLTDQYKLAVTNGHDNQLEVGVGMRVRF
jgi:predicted porin